MALGTIRNMKKKINMLFRLNKLSLENENFLSTPKVNRVCAFSSYIRIGHYYEFNE